MRTDLSADGDLPEVTKEPSEAKAEKKLSPCNPPKARNDVLTFSSRPGAEKPSLALVNELRDAD